MVRFEDGSEFDVYGDELVPVEACEASEWSIYWVKSNTVAEMAV